MRRGPGPTGSCCVPLRVAFRPRRSSWATTTTVATSSVHWTQLESPHRSNATHYLLLFPRWTFLKYFLHTQFDSGEARRLAQHWHVYLKLSDSSLCLPFGDFKWNWPSFTNHQFWIPLLLRQKLTVLTPVHVCSQLGWKQLGRQVFSTMLFKVLLYPGTSLHKSSRMIFLWILKNEEVDWRCVLSVALKVN